MFCTGIICQSRANSASSEHRRLAFGSLCLQLESPMNVLILGAGSVGMTIAQMLQGSGDYDVAVGDHDAPTLARRPAALPKGQHDAADEAGAGPAPPGPQGGDHARPLPFCRPGPPAPQAPVRTDFDL